MNPEIERVREFVARRDPSNLTALNKAIDAAAEVILLGSAAVDCFTFDSDLDLLLVGKGRRIKSKQLDVMWVDAENATSRAWLGSELATHAAKYGIWLKGEGCWRHDVFFGKLAVRHKCDRLLTRFVRIYSKRSSISSIRTNNLLVRCFLDMQRAVFLYQKKAVPSSIQLMEAFLGNTSETLDLVCSEDLLGRLGRFIIFEFSDVSAIKEIIRKELDLKKRGRLSPWWVA
jgi:hypothetical protein